MYSDSIARLPQIDKNTVLSLHGPQKAAYPHCMMKTLPIGLAVMGAVAIALLANAVSAIWARGDDKLSIWLLLVVLISPLVFISFGLVTSRLGVTVSSGTIDSLLSVTTIAMGLVIFQEWSKISPLQYLGIALGLSGIFLMLWFPKTGA